MLNSTQATVSTYEEGLPAWKRAKRCWTRCSLEAQTCTRRCRCVRSHAPLAARAPIPPQSVALITPPPRGALEPAAAAAPTASVVAMETDASNATVRLPAPPAPPAGRPPPQLPPSRFSAPMRTARTHARTHSLQPAALWGRLGMNLPLLLQRTTRLPRPRRCLPLRIRRDMPPRARSRSTRPSTGRCLHSGDADMAANASDDGGSASENDEGTMHTDT
jgi:hypothetical protein